MLGKNIRSLKRLRPAWSIGQGRLLMFTAFALSVVVAAGVPKGPANAADPAATTPAEDTAIWNPGQVTYQVDNSGCHTSQTASIDAATPAIADTVSAALAADSIKIADFSQDPDMKVVQVSVVQKNGTHIALTIDSWLSNSACAQATSAPSQEVSFTTSPGAGSAAPTPRVLGTVDLADRDRIALVAASSWFKQALKVVAVAAIYVAITVITLGVISGIAAEGGAVIALAAQAALAGCVGFAAADLIAGRVLFPDATATTKDRISVAVRGCLKGAVGGISALRAGPGIAAGVRRRLNTTPAILGDSSMAAANQAGVDVTGLSSMVDGVADGALSASQ
jgi:hypothetical protein